MGLATLMIVFCHSRNLSFAFLRFQPIIAIFEFAKQYTTIGVEVFLLLSGLGLYNTMSQNGKLSVYYRNRFLRIFPAVFIVAAINSAFAYNPVGMPQYICKIFLLEFFINGSRTFWYFSFILLLYLIYPFLHRFIRRRTTLRLLLLFFLSIFLNIGFMAFAQAYYQLIEVAVSRIPVFIVGVWLGYCSKNDKKTPLLPTLSIAVCAFAAAILVLLQINTTFIVRLCTSVCGLSVVLVGAWILDTGSLSPPQETADWIRKLFYGDLFAL